MLNRICLPKSTYLPSGNHAYKPFDTVHSSQFANTWVYLFLVEFLSESFLISTGRLNAYRENPHHAQLDKRTNLHSGYQA